MSIAPFLQQQTSGGTRSITRRDMVIHASKLTGGATLALLSAQGLTRVVAAQDNVVTRIAAAAEIGASPGSAYVRSAAASAAAERGAARVEAAAALASANSDGGAIAQSPVAVAFADPDQGAVAQSVISIASAASEDDTDSRTAAPRTPAPAAARVLAHAELRRALGLGDQGRLGQSRRSFTETGSGRASRGTAGAAGTPRRYGRWSRRSRSCPAASRPWRSRSPGR